MDGWLLESEEIGGLGFETIIRPFHWWVPFLHQEEGPHLDKFIRNSVLGGTWCQISHKCHWAFCLNVSHLEQVVGAVNHDRTICKNRSRDKDGGCNALGSLHPHDHCLLANPVGNAFASPQGQKLATMVQELATMPQIVRKNSGPCANGCTSASRWYRNPLDKTQVLCNACYVVEGVCWLFFRVDAVSSVHVGRCWVMAF